MNNQNEMKTTICPLCGKETQYTGMTSYHYCRQEDREEYGAKKVLDNISNIYDKTFGGSEE